jgi:translation elongation factor P/translation initiation factor 5A
MCVRLNGEIYKVALAEMKVGTAKLPSSVHVRLRNLHTGSQTEQRLHPETKIEDIMVGSTGLDYSYSDGDMLYFQNPQTFDQVAVPKRMVGNYEKFLTDGCRLVVEFFGEEPIDAILPRTADAAVASTGAPRHGENDSAPKSATLENWDGSSGSPVHQTRRPHPHRRRVGQVHRAAALAGRQLTAYG